MVPFCPYCSGVSLLKPNSGKKGTLIIQGTLGNLASILQDFAKKPVLVVKAPPSILRESPTRAVRLQAQKPTSSAGSVGCTGLGSAKCWYSGVFKNCIVVFLIRRGFFAVGFGPKPGTGDLNNLNPACFPCRKIRLLEIHHLMILRPEQPTYMP